MMRDLGEMNALEDEEIAQACQCCVAMQWQRGAAICFLRLTRPRLSIAAAIELIDKAFEEGGENG